MDKGGGHHSAIIGERAPGRLLTSIYSEMTGSRFGISRQVHRVLGKLARKVSVTHCFGLPSYITIEITNACACTCRLCPVGQQRRSRRVGFISWDQFTALVHSVRSHVKCLNLHNWGDPFLHPQIYQMISYAASEGIYVYASSTLRDFNTCDAESLVRSKLNALTVSLHAASEDSYRDYQPARSRNDVTLVEALEKVKAISSAKARLRSPFPCITLSSIVTRNNEHELPQFIRLANELGVRHSIWEASLNLRFLPYDRHMGRRDVDEATLRLERQSVVNGWLPKNNKHVNQYYAYVRDHDGGLPPVVPKWFSCNAPWESVVISSNGDVNLCCGSFSTSDSVGNVFDTPLRKIWNNDLYKAARRNILGRSRPSDQNVQCRECPGALL